MAMSVRFSPELDAQLQKVAEARHTSKHALVLQAVEEHLMQDLRTKRVIESLDETTRAYAETIERLKDA